MREGHQIPQPPAQRYSQTPFPRYRFIPGQSPHPTRDPLGHSFGKTPHKIFGFVLDQWRSNERYLYGVDLYNAGFWWEAHEAWEDIWQTLDKSSVPAQFLQGLIQISASFIKWYSDEYLGAEKLFHLGLDRLKNVAKHNSHFMGLDLHHYLQGVRVHFEKLVVGESTSADLLEGYPFLYLSL